jgi:uncharacterized damage-inducible protein DinB
MYTAPALLDMHERAHRSLQRLLQHCAPFGDGELSRELEGFGYPDLLQQLNHVIGAQEYWMNVIRGLYKDEVDDPVHASVAALEEYRARIAESTGAYLREASEKELNTSREMWTWPGKMRPLVPALIFVRTTVHIYQHQGQVLAMCRLLGRPGPGNLDFPLD